MTTVTLATSNFLVPNGTFIVVLLAFIVVVASSPRRFSRC